MRNLDLWLELFRKCAFGCDSTNTVNLNRNGDETPKKFVLDTCKLREKCPNMEFFLIRTFLYLDWILRKSPYSVRIQLLLNLPSSPKSVFKGVNLKILTYRFARSYHQNLTTLSERKHETQLVEEVSRKSFSKNLLLKISQNFSLTFANFP